MDFINVHTHQAAVEPGVLGIVNQYPQSLDVTVPFFSVGIHPWYIEPARIEADLRIISDTLALEHCLALGECGLDKRTAVPLELQVSVFEQQLVLAEKYQKPMIIHCVAAFQELIELKVKNKITVPMVVHGFSKNEQVAAQLLKNGFYLSFGKYLLQNPELERVFCAIPNDRFFLETDTVAETIQEVYAVAAHYKKIELKELQKIIAYNFNTVFKDGRMD